MRLSAALVAASLALAAPAARPAMAAGGFAIVGATVLDGTGAPARPDAVLVVEGDRITALGSRAEVPLPKGIRIVDGRGKWVMPGLVDAHVHFFQSGGAYTRPDVIDLRGHRTYEQEIAGVKQRLSQTFARYLLSGVTSVVDAGGPMWNFEVREVAARTTLAPRVAVAGPLVSTVARPQLDLGDPPIVKVGSPAEARALVQREAGRRPDFIKIWFIQRAGDDPAAGRALLDAVVDESRRAGLRVAVHATELAGARAAVDAGAAILVHSVFDMPVDDAFVAAVRDRGVLCVPTLFVVKGYDLVLSGRFAPTAAERRLGDPDALRSFDEIKGFPEFKGEGRATADKMVATGQANLVRLAAAGARIAVGTDAGNIGTLHGPSIFRELRLMVDAGLSPAQVLSAATLGGARVMGREALLGTLAAGKVADLLVLDGDPTADLSVLESPRDVVKGGRFLDGQELRRAAGQQ
ncbi:MAG: amidohydrolase [Acidobacteria bacterium]|nr:MAG: amidohydrolase [Acidobacteriota bacterium]